MSTAPTPTAEQVLDLRIDPRDGPPLSLRAYLLRLLTQLWWEGSDFSAKRPLGYSDWQDAVYQELVRAGWITGTLTEDGELDDLDLAAADQLVADAISSLAGDADGDADSGR